jgi:carbon monoxide dehydrogenase subunit G
MTGSVEDGFEATVKQKIGPVSASFSGVVKLSDIDPGRAVTITGEGKGGAAGFAKGGAKVRLAPNDAGTELAYEVDASVGGKIAQLGSRLIDGFAKKMADEFFTRFQDAVEPPEEGEAEGEANTEEAPKKGWFKRMIGA